MLPCHELWVAHFNHAAVVAGHDRFHILRLSTVDEKVRELIPRAALRAVLHSAVDRDALAAIFAVDGVHEIDTLRRWCVVSTAVVRPVQAQPVPPSAITDVIAHRREAEHAIAINGRAMAAQVGMAVVWRGVHVQRRRLSEGRALIDASRHCSVAPRSR